MDKIIKNNILEIILLIVFLTMLIHLCLTMSGDRLLLYILVIYVIYDIIFNQKFKIIKGGKK